MRNAVTDAHRRLRKTTRATDATAATATPLAMSAATAPRDKPLRRRCGGMATSQYGYGALPTLGVKRLPTKPLG
jgi:hypothetical protein